tara:strand:+ start:601 stop:1554 length:954 start_codon:yes stop_codon:yes gene_type:complete
MRIYIDIGLKHPSTGKGFFVKRLSKSLSKLGVEIVPYNKKHDIALHIIKVRKKTRAIRVMRLNGIYHNNRQNFRKMNNIIALEREKCHAVIYQSSFAKTMNERYLPRTSVPSAVILNGADPDFYSSVPPARREYEYNFITSSRWRPHKRLRDTIESFLLSKKKSSCLHIVGSLDKSEITKSQFKKYNKIDGIKFYNTVDQKVLAGILKICDGCIHLCMTDCCPNSVVEAVCAGVPVICSNEGGTKEIVSNTSGIVLNIDKKYDLKPIDLYSPPKIDRSIVADAIVRICNFRGRSVCYDNVHIDRIASQYLTFFESIL